MINAVLFADTKESPDSTEVFELKEWWVGRECPISVNRLLMPDPCRLIGAPNAQLTYVEWIPKTLPPNQSNQDTRKVNGEWIDRTWIAPIDSWGWSWSDYTLYSRLCCCSAGHPWDHCRWCTQTSSSCPNLVPPPSSSCESSPYRHVLSYTWLQSSNFPMHGMAPIDQFIIPSHLHILLTQALYLS